MNNKPVPPAVAEFVAGERQQLIARVAELERELAALKAQAALAQSERVPDVSVMAKVLSDRSADACNIDRTDNWAMYGQEYIEDVQAMLAAVSKGGE